MGRVRPDSVVGQREAARRVCEQDHVDLHPRREATQFPSLRTLHHPSVCRPISHRTRPFLAA
eukprot:2822636-Rhodomonas_salina.2